MPCYIPTLPLSLPPSIPPHLSLSTVLDEAPAVHVAHVAPALHPQDVEAAHALPKSQRDLAGVLLLLRRQYHGISMVYG